MTARWGSSLPRPRRWAPWAGPFVLVSLHPGESPIGPFSTKEEAEEYLEEQGRKAENYTVRALLPPGT